MPGQKKGQFEQPGNESSVIRFSARPSTRRRKDAYKTIIRGFNYRAYLLRSVPMLSICPALVTYMNVRWSLLVQWTVMIHFRSSGVREGRRTWSTSLHLALLAIPCVALKLAGTVVRGVKSLPGSDAKVQVQARSDSNCYYMLIN